MILAKKGLLDHVLLKRDVTVNGYGEIISRESPVWRTADLKALAIIAKPVDYNRVALNQKLNEFKLASGGNLYDNLTPFKELITALATAGDPLDKQRQLVILLGSLPRKYQVTVKIIEIITTVTMLQAAEMSKREYAESDSEETEVAFQSVRQRNKSQRQPYKFRGKCFNSGKIGHKEADCRLTKKKKRGQEYVFAVTQASQSEWLLDSGASAHVTNDVVDLKDAAPISERINIVVADGTVLTAELVGTVEILLDDGSKLLVNGVLYIPGLSKKLLAVAKIVERGIRVPFVGNVCELSQGGKTFLTLENGAHGLFSVNTRLVVREETTTEAIIADKSTIE
ncbi:polyprotein [Phytophthora megakarya]|uniref:Polyprotein n=1 Tax=Phytophthora megakarya TaxID=4795 RepID=A0A225VEL2_9STRA|nr:polyprotein [Phytophthora megakarya]